MNTNDFYKELFEKYALNEDKIRRNAIKEAKTPVWKRTLGAHWKTFAGAAAAVAVTVGVVAYTTARSGDGIDIVSHEDVLSASQRLQEVERNYYNVSSEENESGSDVFVSFAVNVCYNDIVVSLSAVSDNDDISVCRLYLEDGTVINGIKDIVAFAETSRADKCIIGAKLYAPVKYYKDLMKLSLVYVAELGSDKLNDRTFVPLRYEDGDPLVGDYDFVSTTAVTPSVTTTPFVFVSETSVSATEPEQTTADINSDTTEPPATDISESDPAETSTGEDPADSTSAPDGSEESTSSSDGSDITTGSNVAAETTTASESETTTTVTSEEPDMSLISQIYRLNVENAVETVLIGDHAIVLGRENVYFYRLGGIGSVLQAKSFELASPKVIYSDENTVMLSGCGSTGLRNTVAIYDMKAGKVYISDASVNLGSAEIGIVQYSSVEDKFFMKAVSGSMTYFYEMSASEEDGIQFRPLFEYNGVVSTAGCKDGKLWFVASEDGVNYSLYSFDYTSGEQLKLAELGTSCKIRRSPTLESFLIVADDPVTNERTTRIYNVNNGRFITVDADIDTQIAVSGDTIYIRIGQKTYSVASDGVLTESSANIKFSAKTDSRYVVIYSGPDRIEVAEKNPNSWDR